MDSHLVDTLPAGVQYITNSESLAWTPLAVGVSASGAAVNSTGARQVITWTFGSPIISLQDQPTVVTLTFQAQATGVQVNNGAIVWPDPTLVYAPQNDVSLIERGVTRDTASATNQVIQPRLTIDKDSVPAPNSYVGARPDRDLYDHDHE